MPLENDGSTNFFPISNDFSNNPNLSGNIMRTRINHLTFCSQTVKGSLGSPPPVVFDAPPDRSSSPLIESHKSTKAAGPFCDGSAALIIFSTLPGKASPLPSPRS
jgi:hypothetical protein